MAALLQELDIFELCPLITNLNCKLSTVSEYDARKQLLCLVSEENDIVLRYTSEGGQEVLKLVSWFRRTNRVIHDVCFDPSGTWLLVLCFDNTLHIVPALAVVDKTFMEPSNSTHPPQQPYSTTQITSYIIPFVGPHECPNSKRCPNQATFSETIARQPPVIPTAAAPAAPEEKAENAACDVPEKHEVSAESAQPADTEKLSSSRESIAQASQLLVEVEVNIEPKLPANMNLDAYSHDVPASMLASTAPPNVFEDKTGNSQVMATSFMASVTCPYPLAVVWWQTIDGVNRAVIGYSDGSICFVGLSPNCPFVASTAIDTGSVVKLLICKDSTFESVMLLITSSLKQQFKLLLEQKAIKYIYPGEISPSAVHSRDSDWQIVMPLKTQSNCSDPASDNSALEEDVFLRNDENPSTSAVAASSSTAGQASHSLRRSVNIPGTHAPMSKTAIPPPPPPYSVAINRHLDTAPTTSTSTNAAATHTATSNNGSGSGGGSIPTTMSISNGNSATGIRFTQQQLPELDDANARAGILPAARARLASLKSLGTKKLNAIKMRLSDNRHKLEDYVSENTLGNFAIIDSPSLTPEVLNNSSGSFYTIQNLRNTYLLSALHSHTNSLTVHNIDINLKPLFLYKIPKNCFDILISSNLLYTIQYVDLNGDAAKECADMAQIERNTEKENRDTDTEKEEVIDLCEGNDTLLADINSAGSFSADTSATTSGPSTTDSMSHCNAINAVGVISSAMATLRAGDDDCFNAASQLTIFRFENETVLNLYQMATYRSSEPSELITKEEKAKAFDFKDIRSPMDYVQFYEHADVKEEYSLRQMEIMKHEFPKINYDPCYVITNKNVYYIQLKKEPFAIFLDSALAGEWKQCREFCNTFDLTYEACIEFAGDYLLRRKRVTQALVTYNSARIKPIRTALKLAMFGQTCALMHLCAMALKTTYLLKSKYFSSPIIKTILKDITYRHSEDVRTILPLVAEKNSAVLINEGVSASDYNYGVDDSLSNLQMSPSSQFHLANLLLITLAERAVNDKNYLPLWNFLVTNTKYHTNMTSIVLCQSGLFSSALVLAKTRGVCIDTFLALTSVVGQEFGWYTEMNVCLYNLSEPIFAETITYLPQIAVDYFAFIQEKLPNIRHCVLERLEHQLNPFSAVLRPIVSHTSSGHVEHNINDNKTFLFDFCKNLIETYLAVLIHMESQRSKSEHITNALSTFRITYEDNQFAIETSRFKPISAGCAHCACVVDGVAYFWGSYGVPCNYSVNKSSDPPEPPHAVKSLDLLSQLNLEVHTVKCGRQHTLVLTNNGLYSFGNNNLLQLGIGRDMQVSLQPMLVRAFDGKNVTIIEAGQYHNAAIADGVLYTWGWGIYGQLGHGNCENVAEPKVVAFFKTKKVLQVSLGHAHSLVLCQAPNNPNATELFVFGSNHFGQLGIGSGVSSIDVQSNASADDEMHCANQVKSLVPIKLFVCAERIRLIHTKFFSNLAVDEHGQMYTWGSSPQALRLANQIKRRANAKQKMEEHQRREMSKQFEATLPSESACIPCMPSTSKSAYAEAPKSMAAEVASSILTDIVNENVTADIALETKAQSTEPELIEVLATTITAEQMEVDALKEADEKELIVEDIANTETEITIQLDEVVEEIVEKVKPLVAQPLNPLNTATPATDELAVKNPHASAPMPVPAIAVTAPPTAAATNVTADVDPCEHMTPHLVDTTEVAGEILQISSGLFHFALISSTCTLYTWGKNLEHQLGTGDKERRAVSKPSPVDCVDRPMYVDCGADFTLVMTTEFMVKAFGGNSNGQCGRDLGPSIDKMKQRVVCLPTTKRLMRFESQCVDVPVEINLPRPRIRLESDPVRYLKSIPKYQPQFMQEAGINFDNGLNFERPSPSNQYKSTTQADSSENVVTGQDSDDMISSLENLSNNEANDGCSLNFSLLPSSGAAGALPLAVATVDDGQHSAAVDDLTPDEQSYARLPVTDNSDVSGVGGVAGQQSAEQYPLVTTTKHHDANGTQTPTQAAGSQSTLTSNAHVEAEETAEDVANLQQLRQYIHYCLYVFHGLYNPDKVCDCSKQRLEYRIRTLMLNFKFVDAFVLCLQNCNSASKTLKIFAYFSKDTGSVPLRRQDVKYLIYYLLKHFMALRFDMLECERFFLGDLDYYLLELSYVLFFNNNNTMLEHNLNEKFKSYFAQEESQQLNQNRNDAEQVQHKLEDTDVIFDSLSVKFKTIVCQRLMQHCNN
uniref:X-linked retinitis pigmentosa GTPase regulator homolog n=1 Tax=Zeugodacus cucurbitae TaxID=28588 RepID=A0A0A1XQW8_ZEUCU